MHIPSHNPPLKKCHPPRHKKALEIFGRRNPKSFRLSTTDPVSTGRKDRITERYGIPLPTGLLQQTARRDTRQEHLKSVLGVGT